MTGARQCEPLIARSARTRASIPDCTGALVAGGRALRLGGIAKGLLRRGREPIAARSLRLFANLFPSTLIVANDAASYAGFDVPVVADVLAGKGAPGGVHAALDAAETQWVFAGACDMPALAPTPIAWLASQRDGAPAVAVVWRGQLQPMHAFWSRACLPVFERMLRQGEPSLWQLATAVGARLVPEERWREIDPDGASFDNANTLEDAARLGLELP